jgi:hypothetical protein
MRVRSAATSAPGHQRLSQRVVLAMAMVLGTSVANPYYAQPLLGAISGALRISEDLARLLVTASQTGDAAGLALLLPLGNGGRAGGRTASRPRPRMSVTTGTLVGLLASWGLLVLGIGSLGTLLAGIVLLDLAQQTLQINHQNAIYALRTEARNRLTTAYTVSVFLGGAIASAATAAT